MASDHLSDPSLSPNISNISQNSHKSVILITLPVATKLNQSNYLAWQSQILPILHGYNLSKFIESAPPSPTRSSTTSQIEINPDFLLWRRQDQLLLGWIRSSLTESIQAQVVSCSSTIYLWIALQKQFASTSSSRRLELKRQFQACRKGATSCYDYLQSLRRIADKLAFIGSPIAEEDLVMHTIQGLGTDFNPIVAAVNAASHHTPFSFSDLHGLLLGHEALLKTQASSTTPAAFYAGNGSSNPSRNRSNNGNRYRPVNPLPILLGLPLGPTHSRNKWPHSPMDLVFPIRFVLNLVIPPNSATEVMIRIRLGSQSKVSSIHNSAI